MNTNKEVLITQAGLEETKQELIYLKGAKRIDIAQKIKTAREFGDISENSEYDEAKNEQAETEVRIVKLEGIIKFAKIIDEKKLSKHKVSIGSMVTVLDIEYDEEDTYKIVGSTEADPYENKISNESPVGMALLGHKVGTVVEVQVPSGMLNYKIVKIV
jgi:transcription elongation factor GreA